MSELAKKKRRRLGSAEHHDSASSQQKGNQERQRLFPLERSSELLENADAVTRKTVNTMYHLVNVAGAVPMAMKAEEELKPKNLLEQLLIHQLVSVHQWGMTMLAQMNRQGVEIDIAAKFNNVACRLMTVYQNGIVTLDKLRNGGKQEMVVQHVHVNGDAQAVVAGKMDYKPAAKKSDEGGPVAGGPDGN